MEYQMQLYIQLIILFLQIDGILNCHSFNTPQQPTFNRRARARGVTSMDQNTINLDYSNDDKCLITPPYSSDDIRSLASIFPFSEQSELSVSDGGKVSCSFDSDMEYCSWRNVQDTVIKFWKGQFGYNFNMDRFDCTNIRQFHFNKNFLLASGEPLLASQRVAIETQIPCQYGNANVKFDFWANTGNPILRYCILEQSGDNINCEDILPMPNPINFTIPMTAEPIRIQIEIVNMEANDIVLIDNLYYDGQLCELIDESDTETTTTSIESTSSSDTSSIGPFLITGNPVDSDGLVDKFFEEEGQNNINDKKSVFGIRRTTLSSSSTTTSIPITTDEVFNELSPCSALSCSFNDDDSCFYALSGYGSTSPWIISDHLVGNRHMGIQRVNLNDQKKVGFVYVGSDTLSNINNIFVMESPKFTLTNDTQLVFDVYLRSYHPRLKVCIDNFDDCPYSSPQLDTKLFWHSSHKVPLKEGSRKIFFVVQNVHIHEYIGIDNIHLETDTGTPICVS